ncbi:hypothetical protein [Streptomyces bauhiniae]|uniref:hypothetical protein n=1 Tax=Streptomyces bauhiniae TaxID=2340725 RepID=UPI0037F382C1
MAHEVLTAKLKIPSSAPILLNYSLIIAAPIDSRQGKSMNLLHKIFSPIDTNVTQLWLAIPIKVVTVSIVLLFIFTVARFLAVKFWVEVSMRMERRLRYSTVLDAAERLGARVGNPQWRSHLPRSWTNLQRKSPKHLIRYAVARRLTRQMPAREIRKMAWRRSRVELLSRTPKRLVEFFSRRPLVVLMSGAVVYEYERPGRTREDLQLISDQIPKIAEQRTWVPVLVLAVGVFAFTRSGNLIDKIRARDEAAKDVNRMLAELLAKLSELDVSLRSVHENINSYRFAYLDIVSGAAESGRTWYPEFGFTGEHYGYGVSIYGRKSLDILLEEPEFQRLQRALNALADHLTEIRDKGVSSVALRILSPVWEELYECRLQSHLYHVTGHHTLGVQDSMLGLGWMKGRLEFKERSFEHAAGEDVSDDGQLDSLLIEESYHLDELVLRSKLTHCQLQRIERFLLKRLHGTPLTKLVSAVGHK